jgi:hypothetical protein
MSDTCWMTITCLACDQDHFKELGFVFEQSVGTCGAKMVDDQADYGHSSELAEIAKKGIPFTADGGPGGDYGCFTMVSLFGELIEVETTNSYDPVVHVSSDGSIDAGGLDLCRRYWERYKTLKAIFNTYEEGDQDGQADNQD